jgi:nicotinamide mononucleotide transporter
MDLIEILFGQYSDYSNLHIALEVTAIVASLLSVYFSFKNSVLVFPFGIVSTVIYVYLLLQWNLLGDMIINGYYFIMSVYGWYIWSQVQDGNNVTPITATHRKEWNTAVLVTLAGALAVFIVYKASDRLEAWVSYVDMITTGIFFAGMWLMARRKLEHWLVLLVGNVISVPLYVYKGYTFSALLYLILAIIAYFGFVAWKKYIENARQVA